MPSASLKPLLLPTRCIDADSEADGAPDGDDVPCRIGVHHLRDRKTGPAVPIAVLYCYTHGRAFTLYPLGPFPYGRAALAPVDSDDGPSRAANGEPAEPDALDWSSTVFGGAVEMSETGTKPQPIAPADAWWATEPPDVLKRPAPLLGLEPAFDGTSAELLDHQLGIPSLRLNDARQAYRQARGVVARRRS